MYNDTGEEEGGGKSHKVQLVSMSSAHVGRRGPLIETQMPLEGGVQSRVLVNNTNLRPAECRCSLGQHVPLVL